MFDVAVIGAGMAGLVCAQQLRLAGYRVVVIEKSRGLGGRVATRRLHGTSADHGLRYLQAEGLLESFIPILSDRQILQVWTDTVYELQLQDNSEFKIHNSELYVAPQGMSAIAKFLATGLEIWTNQRVEAILDSNRSHWDFTLTSSQPDSTCRAELTAKAVVVAIPAPQAFALLQPLAESVPAAFLARLGGVQFDPCLSVIAGYPAQLHQPPDWKAIDVVGDFDLSWIGFDSSKRLQVGNALVFVLHSSAEFARRHLEAEDLQPFGEQLLARASDSLLPWLATPAWMQVHRWRYAFPRYPLPEAYLSAETSLPLVCCGDWCGGDRIASALQSGIAAAEQINRQMQGRALSQNNFSDFLIRAISN